MQPSKQDIENAARLAEAYAGDTRSRESKESLWLVHEFTEEQLAALIAEVRRQAMEEAVHACAKATASMGKEEGK